MAVGGPNTRNDYHGKYLSRQEFLGEGKWLVLTRGLTVNETEVYISMEYTSTEFYQLMIRYIHALGMVLPSQGCYVAQDR